MSKQGTTAKKTAKSPIRKKTRPQKVNTKTVLHSSSYNGSLEIRAENINLTTVGEKYCKNLIGKRGNIRVCWNFMNFPNASTPSVPITGKKMEIRHAACYEVSINEAFLKYLTTKPISFEVYLVNFKHEVLLGRGDAIFKELMNSPNEPITVCVEISNLEKALLVNNPNLFRIYAELNMSYQIKCDVKYICKIMQKRYNKTHVDDFMFNVIESLGNKEPAIDEIDKDYDSELIHDPISLIEVSENSKISLDEPKMIELSSDLSSPERHNAASPPISLNSHLDTSDASEPHINKVRKRKKHSQKKEIKKTSSEESLGKIEKPGTSKITTIKEETYNEPNINKTPFHKQKNCVQEIIPDVKRILEEYAILSGEDPAIVNTAKWKDTNLSKVYLRSFNPTSVYFHPEVSIFIHSLKLYEYCALIKDGTIKSFYLEYSFLSHEGLDMESPGAQKLGANSLFKFNFKKTFSIDLNNNFADCKLLASMIREKKTIVVEVISEPVESLLRIQSCEIVGYSEISLFDLIQLEDNVLKAKFEVKNFKNPSENIGYLRITFSGIQAMRNAALQLLAPSSYWEKYRNQCSAVKRQPSGDLFL